MSNTAESCNACSGSGPEPKPKAAVRIGQKKSRMGDDEVIVVERAGGMSGGMSGGNIAVIVVSVLLIVVVICIIVMCACRKPVEDTYRVTRQAMGAASDASSVVTVSGPGFGGGGSWRQSRGGSSSVDFSYGTK
jgi:hypothetical protein